MTQAELTLDVLRRYMHVVNSLGKNVSHVVVGNDTEGHEHINLKQLEIDASNVRQLLQKRATSFMASKG